MRIADPMPLCSALVMMNCSLRTRLSGESAVQAIAESVKAAPREFRDFEKKAARV